MEAEFQAAFMLAIVAAAIEFLFYFVAPRQLARGARLTLAETFTELPRRHMALGYRDPQPRPWRVSELDLSGLEHRTDRAVGGTRDGEGWLRLRYRALEWLRVFAVVRIEAAVEGQRLHLRARFMTVPLWSLIGYLPLIGFIALEIPGIAVVFVLILIAMLPFHAMLARGRITDDTEALMRAMADRAVATARATEVR